MSSNAKRANVARQQKLENKEVYYLYVLIVAVLGALGLASLLLGKDSYSTSIITALTTIAGFAVGDVANVTK